MTTYEGSFHKIAGRLFQLRLQLLSSLKSGAQLHNHPCSSSTFPRGIRRRGRELPVRPSPGLVLEGFDLPVYSVLNVVQHSLVARISRELPELFWLCSVDHEAGGSSKRVVGVPTSNRLGRVRVNSVYDRVGEVGNLCFDVFPRARSDWMKSVVGGGLGVLEGRPVTITIRLGKAKRLFVSKEMINGLWSRT
ncbi:hypothetical protein TNCV_4817671 [Trichonephila clavipes]|nr:hypothetical protein TNCV_4817671 [Trichonephila clavipes]